MLKRQPDNRMSFRTPATGFGIMMLSIGCFLILLWVLMIAVRIVKALMVG